jgi:DNA-binding transcriptional LysR family regulator
MNIEHLKLFCDIVQLENFTKAAKRNGVSQSRASQILNMLERKFGVLLLDRTQRPWVLTPEGEVLFRESPEIVSRYENVVQQINHASERVVIYIGAIYSVAVRHMRLFIKRYSEHEPNTEIILEYLHPEDIIRRVLKGELDIGVISFVPPDTKLDMTPWQDELMVLACCPGHPLSSNSDIDVSDIRSERMVMFDRSLLIRKKVDEFLAEHDITDPIEELEFDNVESMKRAVEAGSGVSIIPRPTFEREIRRGSLCAVHFRGEDFCRPLTIITRKGRQKSPKIHKFIQFLRFGNPI